MDQQSVPPRAPINSVGTEMVGQAHDAVKAPATSVADGSTLSVRNFTLSRKVQRLLDVNVNDNLRELVLYMNEAVPDFLENLLPSGSEAANNERSQKGRDRSQESFPAATPPTASGTISAAGSSNTPASSSANALKKALESRVLDLHHGLLHKWSTLNDAFEGTADLVARLDRDAETLENTLNTYVAHADEFVGLMTTLQAELSLVQQREKEVKEFQEKYHFTAEDQQVLEESSVDASYLDVLERVQVTHRKCRELLHSRQHYQSAATVMDITYIAIVKGSEKVARHLISAFTTSASGAAAFSGESPELTGFHLRCLNFLREENLTQWAFVVEEMARLRRAVVLRQYFHLMTTGSATTSAGTYRAGSANRDRFPTEVGGGSGPRPLEAEIGNPVLFFSSLFAWLHQALVDESDFISPIFAPLLVAPRENRLDPQSSPVGEAEGNGRELSPMAHKVVAGANENDGLSVYQEDTLLLKKEGVLDSIFEILCKPIQAVLDGVLERFLRSASNLQEGDGVASLDKNRVGTAVAPGPMGLTGSLTRLFSAVAGRPATMASDSSDGLNRYHSVMNRSQLEVLVATAVGGFTNGLQTTHALLQLFSYYSLCTFSHLLGRDAALTRLIADDAKLQLLRVYHTIAKQLAEHSLDSVTSIVSRSPILRRLATVGDLEMTMQNSPPSFVADFLAEYAVEEETLTEFSSTDENPPKELQSGEGSRRLSLSGWKYTNMGNRQSVSNPYLRSGLTKHQAQAAELLRTLNTLVLPPPPEVEESLRVLRATLLETSKHAEVMESLRAAQFQNQVAKDNTADPAGDDSPQNEQFFAVIIQHILSFQTVLSRQETLSKTLDEPCKLALQLNTMSALQETLEPCIGPATSKTMPTTQITPLTLVVSERVGELTKALSSSLSQCLMRRYFGRRAEDSLAVTASTGQDTAKTTSSLEAGNRGASWCDSSLNAPATVTQLSEFFSAVATSGKLYVPIISALRSLSLREVVGRNVAVALFDAYKERYEHLLKLEQEGTGTAAQSDCSGVPLNDLDPKKLQVLMGISQPNALDRS
ncbi:hypothetical protein TRVL_03086 [Trypanosoma vivax]|nr:hypothetical protein TRVL_03086 [Trypanosoma vivax]